MIGMSPDVIEVFVMDRFVFHIVYPNMRETTIGYFFFCTSDVSVQMLNSMLL